MSRVLRFGELKLRYDWRVALCVLLLFLLLLGLGIWQLGRAAEKRALQQQSQTGQLQQATPLLEVLGETAPKRVPRTISEPVSEPVSETAPDTASGPAGSASEGLEHRRVSLEGHYLNEYPVYLVYQMFQGRPGYEVLVPFQLSSGDTVLVSRGWTGGTGGNSPGEPKLPAVADIGGGQQLTAQLHRPAQQSSERLSEAGAWPLLLRRLDRDQVEAALERQLLPVVARLEAGQPGVMIRHWPAQTVDTSVNVNYALQWFAMALGLLLISLLVSTNVVSLLRQ